MRCRTHPEFRSDCERCVTERESDPFAGIPQPDNSPMAEPIYYMPSDSGTTRTQKEKIWNELREMGISVPAWFIAGSMIGALRKFREHAKDAQIRAWPVTPRPPVSRQQTREALADYTRANLKRYLP